MKTLRLYSLALSLAVGIVAYAQEQEPTNVQRTKNEATKVKVEMRTVTGKVMSVNKKTPLGGALLSVVGYNGYSTLSQEDGSYTLKVPVYAGSLKVTAPDHTVQHVAITQSGEMDDIIMYSSATKELYSDDVNIMNHANITNFEYSSAINITSEIGDQLGGLVHTITRGGTPGVGNYMNINGLNSLHANTQPLVIIDDVIIDQQFYAEMMHDGFYNDVLSMLNVNDIESVKVMTNGTALYGAKGANGVIIVKTKRNKSLATKIDAVATVGFTMLPKLPSMMNGSQYKTYISDLLGTTGTKATEFKFLTADPKDYYYNKYNNNTDWNDFIYDEAITQNYGISVQGGGEVASYSLSLGYTGAQSVLEENNMNRFNIRFNTDIELSRKFFIRFDAYYANMTRNLKDTGAPASYDDATITSMNFLGLVKSPMLSPYSYANGKINTISWDKTDEDYLDEALRTIPNADEINYKLANPAAINEYGTAQNKNYFDNNYVNIAFTPKWVINRNLTLSSLFSYNLMSTKDQYYVPMNGVPSYYVNSIGITCDNEIGSLYSSQTSVTSDTKLAWNKQYYANTFGLLGGFRFMNDNYKMDTQMGYDSGNDKTPGIGNTKNKLATGANNQWRSLTWYGQATYDYGKRYFIQGDLAIESSSRFGNETKGGFQLGGVSWGVFPSVQAAWLVTNEKWFNVKGIDYLKLTAGYDMSGNDGIDFDASRTFFHAIKFQEQANGLVLGNIGNNEVQWETTKRFNVGLDLNAINNRLNVKFNYFSSKIDNLLTFKQLSYLTGLKENWTNGGAMKNHGINASFNALLLAKRNWNWEVGASVGHYKNELTALPDGEKFIETEVYGATIRSEIGKPINQFYGYKTAATKNGTIVYATADEAKSDGLYQMAENGVTKEYFGAGDVKFHDVDNNKDINKKDMVCIGDPNPDIFGNISTSLSYKRLRLDVNFNYSLGNDVYNYQRSQLEAGTRFFNQTEAMVNRWTFDGQKTNMPRAAFEDPMGNARFSDRWIEDGSYLKLKTITLSYNLPINNTYIHGFTFWGQANNLLTLTKYLGSDPETSMSNAVLEQGIDRGLLPNSRNFVIGVKINL